MKKAYTKEYIFSEINDFLENSCVLKNKTVTSVFTVNQLLYLVESVKDINGPGMDLQINTNEGMYIPCECNEPYFVDINTRSKKVQIKDIEIYDNAEDEEDPDWVYLIIVKEFV